MKRLARTITVFGSSRPRPGDPYYEEARQLGGALASAGFAVCSGGYGGVMEAVSRGAKEAGGKTLAVTAKFFRSRANPWVDEEISVETWQERLFELIRRGHGYVTCRGGTGTLVELAVVWEMINKGVMKRKPVVALGSFWGPVVQCVREVGIADGSRWIERDHPLITNATSPAEAVVFLGEQLGLAT
ncbi:MAG TPA: LOG family protein [Candidatus Acidoferrales bacterium]|nr:LOG family protein [Candidatus Acidoferrales bacterium]